ncbi:4-hydroxybutyryl-CoA dehydratase/vinylacetyl-CoA-Delta-isomerase [Bradyrhizobium sp. USDA 4524]|uniref:4-hydroxyphenylacetate 3-hydroxylase family protein n=1 Tax=unclassified Bradyrhizobium TaxID=2631580 RepID=UPI00209F3FCE|nr:MULTISPECIES: 4-hydroxyphenylacetate 3-hydroxylase N-terminal domain-containing protein [unclassified Bradyrhizobium]MCP1842284.1 4-hydroxybutyryl-CoA dehydratase/vinylacetyl-CoA-Delta-isomerase [Bradyrhizobium sp. USDA 4538]MCP1902848.1 4-hydroxybutyryl-CoA dehydratase/vinylacetyl-CoA-Delta-isomerase [Bradyrhizobium sp. USDA 4537]MCP1991495.1 4-hydroxybutyryl-CoA dehydratase/vinylacetyl-CoA-Delta-isomerase [Bradyrhizobium sp. USDA 4539]
MLMTAADYRESLRRYKPRVFINGAAVASVADEPLLAPGVAGVGVTYDFALQPEHVPIMTARQGTSGKTVNRMLHINRSSQDLLDKLEAVRLVCRTSGCAQRYLTHDALNGLFQATRLADDRHGTDYSQRFLNYLHEVQDQDLTLGIAMTDAKGDRSKRPGLQANADVYVHIKERRPDGIVIRGTKAIVTGAPYMHEFLVMPCRTHVPADKDFAVCCAVPVDAPGVTIVARPAGRPGDAAAKFSAKYGQSVGVVMFDDVFVPHDRVFLAGETEEGGFLTTSYATHHRHSCIGARAGFGDLLIGAGALMIEANGLDAEKHAHIREAMVELITITESFYACGVASSVYCTKDPAGSVMPDAVFSNIGKLLLATKIYDMHRVAHYVSGGLIVALPGPDEDHNPETRASLAAVMGGRPDIPAEQRAEVARLIEDLTVSHEAGWYSVISLHGGGSPEAMKREIWRNYPVMEKAELVENLLGRDLVDQGQRVSKQPGRCCASGCEAPTPSAAPMLGDPMPS